MADKLLIVDDEPSIVVSLEFLLRQAGYDYQVARDADEALRQINTYRPDLVLLDVMLPGKNGYEICQYIRQTPEIQDTKVILLTAKGRPSDMEKGIAVGANAYVTKPFAIKDLMQKVEAVLAS